MRSSTKQGKIAAALLRLHAEAQPVTCDRLMAETDDAEGYRFASIVAVTNLLTPLCEKHELVYVQGPGRCEDANRSGVYFMALTTRIIHIPSGEWIEDVTTWPVGGMGKPDVAAAVTQARKASLLAMFGLVVEGELERTLREKLSGRTTYINGKASAAPEAVQEPEF